MSNDPAAPPRGNKVRWIITGCLLVLAVVCVAHAGVAQSSAWLSSPDHLADGVDYFTSTDRSLVDPPAPIAVFLASTDSRWRQ